MRSVLTLAFLLLFFQAISQKRYDCVVQLRSEQQGSRRWVGQLLAVYDSSVLLQTREGEIKFNWSDCKSLRFRKHNAYMRTYFPVSFAGGVAGAAIAANSVRGVNDNVCRCRDLQQALVTPAGFIAGFWVANAAELTFYFLTRGHLFRISDYPDFQKMKLQSTRYLAHPITRQFPK